MARANRCAHCSGRFFVGKFKGKSAGVRCPRCGRATEVVKGKRWTRRTPLQSANLKLSKGQGATLTKAERSARITANVRQMMVTPVPPANAMARQAAGSFDPRARALAELASHYDPKIRAAAQDEIYKMVGGA